VPSFPDWFANEVSIDWEYSDRPAAIEVHRKIGFVPSLEVIPGKETAPIESDWGSGWEVDSAGRHRRYSKRLRK